VLIRDLEDVLMRDVGDRIKDSGRYAVLSLGCISHVYVLSSFIFVILPVEILLSQSEKV